MNKSVKFFDICLTLFISGFVIFLFVFTFFNFILPVSKSNFYTYNSLPAKYKSILKEYEFEANKYNIDVSRIKKTKFYIIDEKNVVWGGLGYKTINSVFINDRNYNYNDLRLLVWHELGHCILGYGHDIKENSTHIMNHTLSHQNISWEEQKRTYFTEKMDRNYIKNIKPLFPYVKLFFNQILESNAMKSVNNHLSWLSL